MFKKRNLAIILVGVITCSLIVAVATSQCLENTDINQNVSISSATATQYADISKDNWFYRDVVDISQKGLMNGTSDTTFSPADNTNRAMIVTILWRLEGEPAEGKNNFSDVIKGDYYYDAVSWATKNKIVSGYDTDTFGPVDDATREQLVAIMYRYAEYKNCGLSNIVSLHKFTDADSISEYAITAFKWSVANGIITGTAENKLSPDDYVQRSQVAAIINRFCSKYNFSINSDETTGNEVESKTDNSVATDSSNTENKPTAGSEESDFPVYGSGPFEGDESFQVAKDDENIQMAIVKTNIGYGKPGERVSITLDLEKNPGILGMLLCLEYDETAMKLVEVTNGEAVSDVLTLTPSKTLDSGVKFLWDGLDLSPSDIKDGILLNMEFELYENVTVGKRYPLMLSYISGDIVDADLNEINLDINQGYIEVE